MVTVLTLDDLIIQELKALQQELEEKGELPSRQQLEQYYQNFRDRFAPEQLSNLDGEALLNMVYDQGNKDSLLYWIERKRDEEFPAIFGSILGGSAHKFGLFRRKETGIWTTGSPQKSEEISVEQAIKIARSFRDQLIAGAELLERVPSNADDASYETLQQNMKQGMPTIYHLAWAHKYLSLLYPDKLDDYHNVLYQDFHLMKLLLRPSKSPEAGLYNNAGRFVAIARMLEMPISTLTSLLNARHGSPYNYWRIGTSSDSNHPGNYWEKMRDGNFCAIGWEVEDLSDIPDDKTSKQIIASRLQRVYPEMTSHQIGAIAPQLLTFKQKVAPRDLILASTGKRVLGIGRVTDSYIYVPDSDLPHRCPVEWLSIEAWEQPDDKPEGMNKSVYQMKQASNLIEAERRLLDAATGVSPRPLLQVTDSSAVRQATPLLRLTGIAGRIQTILERKGQVILYGPPGTGKTYWAERTACELAARTRFNNSFEQLTSDEQMTICGNSQTSLGMVRICCFHPSYGYEDFIEGLRPELSNGSMHFAPRDGIFKRLCQDARQAPREKFYLIIDEINRGDIPRIFGELLTILEKDKRDKSILLPLTNQFFQVPPNIYLIGTMNTADRSIALLDAALRHRFGFIELMPDSSLLEDTVIGGVEGIPLGLWLDELNSRIRVSVGPDARNLQIGHAYFLEKGHPIADFNTFARVLQDDIVPLLEEYCYEDYQKLEQILGKDLVDVKTQQIRSDLFDPAQQSNLIQAVLAMNPDITTSRRAARAEQLAKEAERETEDNEELANEDKSA